MKVLMLAPGQSVHAQRPLNLLLESGCDVIFMDVVDPLPQGAKNYRFLPYPPPRGKRWISWLGKNLAEWFGFWSVVIQLRLYWHRIRPDVTHMHWISPRRVDQCLKAGMHPLVLSAWGSDINNHFLPDADACQRKLMKQALAKADFTIVDAHDVAVKCSELAGKPVRGGILSLGVDTRKFRPGYEEAACAWRKKLDVPAEALVLLSIRAWSPVYGHHHILEAFAQAFPHLRVPSVLLFKTLNKSGYADAELYEEHIRCRVESLGLAQHVRWLEPVPYEQLPEIYSLADVVLNYPSMDAFPITFQEAAACERPVISVRLPAYERTFAERYFSMVEPGDVSQLVQAITRFVNATGEEMDRWQQMLSQARREVEQAYDEQVYIKGLLDIYQGL
jgi:glycosyltransferase involved in cell wall biosynthesis